MNEEDDDDHSTIRNLHSRRGGEDNNESRQSLNTNESNSRPVTSHNLSSPSKKDGADASRSSLATTNTSSTRSSSSSNGENSRGTQESVAATVTPQSLITQVKQQQQQSQSNSYQPSSNLSTGQTIVGYSSGSLANMHSFIMRLEKYRKRIVNAPKIPVINSLHSLASSKTSISSRPVSPDQSFTGSSHQVLAQSSVQVETLVASTSPAVVVTPQSSQPINVPPPVTTPSSPGKEGKKQSNGGISKFARYLFCCCISASDGDVKAVKKSSKLDLSQSSQQQQLQQPQILSTAIDNGKDSKPLTPVISANIPNNSTSATTAVLAAPPAATAVNSIQNGMIQLKQMPSTSIPSNSTSSPTTNVQTPPPQPPKQQYLLKSVLTEDRNKKCLVLDLDETLIHSSFKPVPDADFIIPVEIDGIVHSVYVLKRPHVDAFLERIGPQYEVVIFTASLAKYADPVIDNLDRKKVVRHRLFRESCSNHRGSYVKDLSLLGRDLKDTIIVDNAPASYLFHPGNAIACTSWFSDPNDRELLDLISFFEELKVVQDVRDVLDDDKTSIVDIDLVDGGGASNDSGGSNNKRTYN